MNGASQKGILIALGVVAAGGIFGAVMAPDNTPQIIGFSTLIATSLLGLLAQIHAAKRTEDKLTNVERTGDATHTLVNSAMSAQLRLNAIMARRLATVTNDPADHASAATAEAEYHKHESKQRIVDKGFGIVVGPAPPLAPSVPAPLPLAPAAGPAGPPGPAGPAGPTGPAATVVATPAALAQAGPEIVVQEPSATDKLTIGHDEKANVEMVITKEPKK